MSRGKTEPLVVFSGQANHAAIVLSEQDKCSGLMPKGREVNYTEPSRQPGHDKMHNV